MVYNNPSSPSGAWAREVLTIPPPVPESPHHRELTSILKTSQAHLLALALELELESARKTVTKQQAVLAPIRRISPEILGHIFRLVFEEESGSNNRYWKQVVGTMAVCRNWRDAVLDTPQLWAWYQMFDSPNEQYLEVANCWLGRSGNVPLSLALEIRRRDTIYILKYLHSIIHRVEHAEIILEQSPNMDPLIRFLRNAPQLRSLQLKSKDYINIYKLHCLPFLQRLSLTGKGSIPKLKCPSLVSLELQHAIYELADLKAFVSASPKLESISIAHGQRWSVADSHQNEEPILLPNLRQLEFDSCDRRFFSDFIGSENLQLLKVKFSCFGSELGIPVPPFPPLRRLPKLEIDISLWEDRLIYRVGKDVVTWLEQADQVQELIITNVNNPCGSCYIPHILTHMANGNLFPLLRIMTIRGYFKKYMNVISEFKKQRPECSLFVISE